MQSTPSPVNRTLTGVLGVICLACGVAVAYLNPRDTIWCGSFIRTGLFLGALWIALPTKGRLAAWANVSPWWLVPFVGLLLILVRRPLVLLPIIATIVVLMAFLPPKRN